MEGKLEKSTRLSAIAWTLGVPSATFSNKAIALLQADSNSTWFTPLS